MPVHHLNCGTINVLGGAGIIGTGGVRGGAATRSR
jgi:hypothetical protein